jgi:hypothetical protein
MGNVVAKKTNKINILQEEIRDISVNISINVNQIAQQNITAIQSQLVILNFQGNLTNCNINISQEANIVASQIATFTNLFSSPRELINKLTKGPNSFINQLINSSSTNVQNFLKSVEKSLEIQNDLPDASKKTILRNKLVTIFKFNCDVNVIQNATQNIFTNQQQRVALFAQECKNSEINIGQTLILNAAQNVMFSVIENSFLNDPSIRIALRDFNGDYTSGFLNDNLEEGLTIPDACFNNTYKTLTLSGGCPPSEKCLGYTELKSLETEIIFKSWFIYITIVSMFIVLSYILYMKK